MVACSGERKCTGIHRGDQPMQAGQDFYMKPTTLGTMLPFTMLSTDYLINYSKPNKEDQMKCFFQVCNSFLAFKKVRAQPYDCNYVKYMFNIIGDERSLNTNCTLCSLKGRRCRTLIKDVHFNHGHATKEMESRHERKASMR